MLLFLAAMFLAAATTAALQGQPAASPLPIRPRSRLCMCSPSATVDAPEFPPGFDPNDGDWRTWKGARTQLLAQDWAPSWSTAYGTEIREPDSCSTLEVCMDELEAVLQTFDFDTSTDEEVAECERAVFGSLRIEARQLASSWLTADLVHSRILQHQMLPDALAALMSSKLYEPSASRSRGNDSGGLSKAEQALRDTVSRVYHMPEVRRAVVSDLVKVLVVDPAADGLLQPMLFFKGFHALATYRAAHALWNDGSVASRGAALMLQSRASELFDVDIHPAATIGNGMMLDHAHGVVIGSTARIGSDVYMLHGVTLGATGKPLPPGTKRHPTVGSRVVLGAGSTVLGDIAIGDDCTVGAAAIVTKPVADGETVVGVNKIVSRPPPQTPPPEAPSSDQPIPVDEAAYTWMYDI